MGVSSYHEVGRPTASVDTKGNRTYKRKYLVVMDSLGGAPPDVWSAAGAPSITRNVSTFPGDSQATARSLDCEAAESQGVYWLTYTYSSEPHDRGNQTGDPAQTDNTTTPTGRPWVIKFGSTHSTRLLTKDVNTGAAVVNSVRVPFDPTIEVPTSNLTLTVTAFKDWSTFDPITSIRSYQDSINDADLLLLVSPSVTSVFPAKTLRCTEYAVSSVVENNAPWWQVDLTLEYKWDKWNPVKILDCGVVRRIADDKPPQPIIDLQGNPVQHPVPLNGAGAPLNAGDALIFLSFDAYKERNFATILS